VAETHAMNLDEHFVRTRILDVSFFDAEGLVRSTCDSGVDFHSATTTVFGSR
jgi:hypothetical protein